ncbi:PREDICTED: 5-methyltetrahydropteroyltriglutamate--homocysteine methyltransferase 2-like [Camelina sativa]|uniref:5-methyltetrahydropteroyltriglutamate--homocysteine S-methyltransferase n=1 Tax=Camelina sativa TaxID=90675 RepID=A0ABM1QZF7_CAMSA|nr:PREDICTED: 5-methyltetrahydropteroyltriglutamate--homocysteine methyltransferase 2-like [Camelina sativa]
MAAGASWIQFDEPLFVMDLEGHKLEAFGGAYAELESTLSGLNVLVETYFADIPAEAYKTLTSLKGVTAFGFDLVRGTKTIDLIKAPEQTSLWSQPLALFSTHDEIKSWLAFAAQLTHWPRLWPSFFTANADALSSRRSSPRVTNESVQKAAAALKGSDQRRTTEVSAWLDAQQKKLNLPILPTTTIGSFPQTVELRRVRLETSEEDYVKAIKEEIKKVVDIDVLVHGEPERNDMKTGGCNPIDLAV